MGNRALIIPAGETFGVYLHWNGGYDSVYPFLEYCRLKGFRDFGGNNRDGYGIARFTQVVANFLGGDLSIGIQAMHIGSERWQDNGAYIIDGWDIVDRISGSDYEFNDSMTETELKRSLLYIDECQPEKERLGVEFIYADVVPVSEIKLGDVVYMSRYDGFTKATVVGFGKDEFNNGTNVNGIPYVDMYDHDGDYSWNPNNYIKTETVRKVHSEL